LSCTLTKSNLRSRVLKNVFSYLDIFGYGYLTKESWVMCFKRRGRQVSPEEVANMLIEMELDPDANITFDGFKKMMADVTEGE